jgi:hypothetical protein
VTHSTPSTAPVPVGHRDPARPAPYDDADVAAIQALAIGVADADQQRHALRWIVETAADAYGLSWRGESHATAFAEGKRFVGLQIVKLSKLRLDTVRAAVNAKDPG